MKEVFVHRTSDNKAEVAALVKTLPDKGYTQFSLLRDGRLLFETVEEAAEVFSGLTPELDALRVRVNGESDSDESDDDDEEYWGDPDEFEDLPGQ